MSQMADVCNMAYTFKSKANGAQSFIDHFLISPKLRKNITKRAVKNDIENLSAHLPVFLHLNIDHNIGFQDVNLSPYNPFDVNWQQASAADITVHKSLLDIKLDNMVFPFSAISCKNTTCKIHHNDIEKLHDYVVNSCADASQMAIKCKTKGRVNIIPGWNDMVKDLRHKAVNSGTIYGNLLVVPRQVLLPILDAILAVNIIIALKRLST